MLLLCTLPESLQSSKTCWHHTVFSTWVQIILQTIKLSQDVPLWPLQNYYAIFSVFKTCVTLVETRSKLLWNALLDESLLCLMSGCGKSCNLRVKMYEMKCSVWWLNTELESSRSWCEQLWRIIPEKLGSVWSSIPRCKTYKVA